MNEDDYPDLITLDEADSRASAFVFVGSPVFPNGKPQHEVRADYLCRAVVPMNKLLGYRWEMRHGLAFYFLTTPERQVWAFMWAEGVLLQQLENVGGVYVLKFDPLIFNVREPAWGKKKNRLQVQVMNPDNYKMAKGIDVKLVPIPRPRVVLYHLKEDW